MIDPAAFPPPETMLVALGIDTAAEPPVLTPLAGGWSGGRIWRVERAGYPPLVLRALAGNTGAGARREDAIHALVREAGIPAPEILAVAEIPGGAAMAMTLMPGIPLAQALLQAPDTATAQAFGVAAGEMLARIHAIPGAILAEAGLAPGGEHARGDWLTWLTPGADVQRVLAPWRHPAEAHRLLHLDFHPENLLVDAETRTVTAVLDWTNARLGPPLADLARTRSILRLIPTMPHLPPGATAILAAFTSGCMDAYTARHGEADPAMLAAFDAWALDVQIADLAPKLGMPGIAITAETLDTLRAARDAATASASASLPER
ncbi:MAG: aminoglycoside phosphotransferase family protein [Thermomicrobiales bacterium]